MYSTNYAGIRVLSLVRENRKPGAQFISSQRAAPTTRASMTSVRHDQRQREEGRLAAGADQVLEAPRLRWRGAAGSHPGCAGRARRGCDAAAARGRPSLVPPPG